MEYASRAENGSMDGYGGCASGAGRQQPYGSIPGTYNNPSKPGYQASRRRIRLIGVATCFFVPIILFASVCAALSFSLHYSSSFVSWLIVGLGLLAALALCYQAFVVVRARWYGDVNKEPYWYIYLAAMVIVAWIFAVYLGNVNYANNTLPYEDLMQLSSHTDVDPLTMPGRQLMDVGKVTFVEETTVDLSKAIGFKNVHQYCVAPIVNHGGQTPESYDYWAVGLDCCTGAKLDYHCGDAANPEAHGGLRLMREDQRAFYRLAVQQAEATYDIKALHPLFFYFMEDPTAELNSWKTEAIKYYLLGLLSFGMCQIMLLILAVVVFTKL